MKVTTVPEKRPDVIITLSWDEARILKAIIGSLGGNNTGRTFVDSLFDGLERKGVESDDRVSKVFSGSFS